MTAFSLGRVTALRSDGWDGRESSGCDLSTATAVQGIHNLTEGSLKTQKLLNKQTDKQTVRLYSSLNDVLHSEKLRQSNNRMG